MATKCPACKVDLDQHHSSDFETCLRSLAARRRLNKSERKAAKGSKRGDGDYQGWVDVILGKSLSAR